MIPSVDIIIPTTASKLREKSLLKAIESAKKQNHINPNVLVIVNGDVYDQNLYERLCLRADIYVYYHKEAGLPGALAKGRSLVKSEYFCFLDDDDLLLDDSIIRRLEPLIKSDKFDVVIGNGYFYDNKLVESFCYIEENPLDSLLEKNWLASCGGLFKTSAITKDIFDSVPQYFEWTWIAYYILLNDKKIKFIDDLVYQVHDSDISLSKNDNNSIYFIELIKKMIDKSSNSRLNVNLNKKLLAAYHNASSVMLNRGCIKEAWDYHMASMKGISIIKYFLYSRKLLYRTIVNWF